MTEKMTFLHGFLLLMYNNISSPVSQNFCKLPKSDLSVPQPWDAWHSNVHSGWQGLLCWAWVRVLQFPNALVRCHGTIRTSLRTVGWAGRPPLVLSCKYGCPHTWELHSAALSETWRKVFVSFQALILKEMKMFFAGVTLINSLSKSHHVDSIF